MARYRKRPVVIEAVQWDGTNEDEIRHFARGVRFYEDKWLQIPTLEGLMTARVNDFIIKGVNGEFYPCKPDIFHKTYEQVDIYENCKYRTGLGQTCTKYDLSCDEHPECELKK